MVPAWVFLVLNVFRCEIHWMFIIQVIFKLICQIWKQAPVGLYVKLFLLCRFKSAALRSDSATQYPFAFHGEYSWVKTTTAGTVHAVRYSERANDLSLLLVTGVHVWKYIPGIEPGTIVEFSKTGWSSSALSKTCLTAQIQLVERHIALRTRPAACCSYTGINNETDIYNRRNYFIDVSYIHCLIVQRDNGVTVHLVLIHETRTRWNLPKVGSRGPRLSRRTWCSACRPGLIQTLNTSFGD